jgi:Growth regulator
MPRATLRNWGGAVAVSLPKKLLSALGLQAGSEVEIAVEADKIVLLPVHPKHTLDELIREQEALEREFGQALVDREWLDNSLTGREAL